MSKLSGNESQRVTVHPVLFDTVLENNSWGNAARQVRRTCASKYVNCLPTFLPRVVEEQNGGSGKLAEEYC